MENVCIEGEINYHLTVPPQLNIVSELTIRTITEKAREMLLGAGLGRLLVRCCPYRYLSS